MKARLTEFDLTRIVRRVINEQNNEQNDTNGLPNCDGPFIQKIKERIVMPTSESITIQTGAAYGAPCKRCLIITAGDKKCACKRTDLFS